MSVSPAVAESRRPIAVNGVVRTHSPANVKLLAGTSYVFSSPVTVPYNGCIVTFEQGPAYQIDALLLAYLATNNITPVLQ